jgi:hypothetical protein
MSGTVAEFGGDYEAMRRALLTWKNRRNISFATLEAIAGAPHG